MNNDDWGCLGTIIAVVLVLLFLGGNMALFSGDTDDMGVAIGIAVIGDLSLVIWGITAWAKSVEQKQEQQRLNELAETEKAIQNLWKKYEPENKTYTDNADTIIVPENDSANIEIINCVKRYKSSTKTIYQELKSVNDCIYQILQKSKQFLDKKESLDFLNNNKDELERLKCKSDNIQHRLSKIKIRLFNDSGDSVRALTNAIAQIEKSKKVKCNLDIHPLSEKARKKKPQDLNMFDYQFSPLMLHFNKSTLCFFERCILVFDAQGRFRTALDPASFNIEIARARCRVSVYSDTINASEFVDTDSKCISKGNEVSSWAHTCRDGSPDLRYSYNPRLSYRTDVMEYGTIKFYDTIYTVSSEAALNAMEIAKSKYCKSFNHYHNPIPSLMELLGTLMPDNMQFITNAKKQYAERSENKNYFCTIIGEI